MRYFIRKLYEDGGEVLGTCDFIALDARRSLPRLISDARYHASVRNWPGYRMWKAPHLREKWTEVMTEFRTPETVNSPETWREATVDRTY